MTADITARRSDASGARRLSAHLGLLIATGTWVLMSWATPWLAAAVVIHGVALSALFCAAHESVHRTAFRSRCINDIVASACGVALLLPSRWFRLFHAAHHRYTQDPARDPELAGWKPATGVGIVLHASGLLYWWAMAGVIVTLSLGRADVTFLPPGHRRRVIAQARAYLVVYTLLLIASIAGRSLLAVQLWLLPAVVGQPFLRAFLLAEHTGCPQVRDVLASTRTTNTNGLVRLITWNMSFHAEHHVQPQVPFHQLPALHRAIGSQVHVIGRGYVRTYISLQRSRWASRP